jgi:hypothetical protein
MTDNITLPRAVALQIREALMVATTPIPADQHRVNDALIDLEAALAEPEPAFQVDAERYRWLRGEVQGPHTPLAQVVWKRNNIRESGDWTNLSDGHALDEAIDAALAEPEKERAETVTSARCVAGSEKPASSRDESYRTTEPPAKPEPVAWLRKDGLRFRGDIEPQDGSELPLYAAPPAAAKPEPATDEQIVKAGGECAVVDNEYLLDFRDGFRAAERFHNIRGSKT